MAGADHHTYYPYLIHRRSIIIIMGQCESHTKGRIIDTVQISKFDIKCQAKIDQGDYDTPYRNLTFHKNQQNIVSKDGQPSHQEVVFYENQSKYRINTPLYLYLSDSLEDLVRGTQIEWVMVDRYDSKFFLYLIKQQEERYGMLIRTFPCFQSPEFQEIAYEVSVYQRINGIRGDHLHRMHRTFTICPSNKFVPRYTQVTILEPVDVSLSTIIHDRRKHQVCWTFSEFYHLMTDCVSGLAALHQASMAHHAILPCNIYYNSQKATYILGCYTQVSSGRHQKVNEQVYYRDQSRVREAIQPEDDLEEGQKADVYSLGMTFLSAFYLCEPISRQKTAQYNRQLSEVYPFLGIIRNMITSYVKRHSIFQIQQSLRELNSSIVELPSGYNPTEVKRKPYDPYKFQRYLAEGYKVLGCIQQWMDSLKHRSLQQMISSQDMRTAEYFHEMGVIAQIQHHKQKSEHYYVRSAEIYRKLGLIQCEQRFYQQAIEFFGVGLHCFEDVEGAQNDLVYLKLLVSMLEAKIVSGYEIVDRKEVLKVEQLVMGLKQEEPFAFWEYMQQIAHIYQYFEEYQKVVTLLEECLQVQCHIKSKVSPVTVEKKIIQNSLRLIQQSTRSLQSMKNMISFTEKGIEIIFDEYEYYFIENPLSKLQLHLLETRLMIHNGEIDQAVAKLESLVRQTTEWSAHLEEHHIAMQSNRFKTLRAQILHYLGDAYMHNGELDKSLSMYGQAFQTYKLFYGNFYYEEAAKLLEKLSMVHKKLGDMDEYQNCHELQHKIFKTIYGPYHKNIAKKQRRLSFLESGSVDMPDMRPVSQLEIEDSHGLQW